MGMKKMIGIILLGLVAIPGLYFIYLMVAGLFQAIFQPPFFLEEMKKCRIEN